VIKNINKIDNPSLLNTSIRQNQFQNTVWSGHTQLRIQ